MKSPFYLVAGLGKTGLSIASYLQRSAKNFIVFDTRKDAPGLHEFQSEFPEIKVYLEHVPIEVVQQLTDVIASPGLPLELPLFQQAISHGAVIYGDIECLAREINAPVVAITGTNGKSTVTTLVGDMARADKRQVAVAGNIGAPVLDLLDDDQAYDLWILELSSFQLDLTSSLKPAAATILNISPDHLDRHHNLEAYVEAKQRVYRNSKCVIYNRDDLSTMPGNNISDSTITCSFGMDVPQENNWGLLREGNTTYLAKGLDKIISTEKILIKGIHNWLNALASCALAESIGISREAMCSVLQSFTGLAHRCQWVRTLDGVDWINDSKGTNVGATLSAIKGIGGSMQGKIVLIAGGQGKGADFDELSQPVADYVRSVVLIGEDADKLEKSLTHVVPITHATTLDNAVAIAKSQAKPGDVVLLSPACASLDMFRDFNHRGDTFASCVIGL